MKQFNVIVEDINSRKFIPYDVIPYLVQCYYEEKDRPRTIKEFKVFIERHSKYQWWSRCEYEIILKSWPTGNIEKKIDVHQQVMMNIDIIAEILMNEVNNIKYNEYIRGFGKRN